MDLVRTDVRREGGWTVVTVRGQLDVATAPEVRQVLVEVSGRGEHRVVLDLDAVEFVDSMGLGVLVGAGKRARANGGDVVLVTTRPRLRELLALTRLDAAFEVVTSVGDVIGR